MPIVPTEPDLIDRLIEVEDQLRRQGAGCGGSTAGDPADTVTPEPDVPTPEAPDSTRAITLPGSCKKTAAGAVRWPNGNPWQFFAGTDDEPAAPNQLEAIGVRAGTTATPSKARLNVKLRWAPAGDLAGDPVRRQQLLFKLPPGWWPARKVSVGVRVLAGGSSVAAWGMATVQLSPDTGHVTVVPRRPMVVDMIDLSTITYDAGGGATGQGDGSLDPTGGGCGAPWEGDPDNQNTQELPGVIDPTGAPVVGGGGGVVADWQDLDVLGGTGGGRALWRQEPGLVRLTGTIVNLDTAGANSINTAAELDSASDGEVCPPGTFPGSHPGLPRVPVIAERNVGGFGQLIPAALVPLPDGSLNVVAEGNPVRAILVSGVSWGVYD